MQQFPEIIPSAFRRSSPDIAPGGSGIILATVLILLGIIVVLVLQAQVLARTGLQLENNRLLRAQLRETAGDGIWRALNVLAADQNLMLDHTNEEWAAPTRVRLPNGIETETFTIDENRFIDANMLASVSPSGQRRPPAEVVRDLLAGERSLAEPGQASNPEIQTQIIQDWVDQDASGDYETEYYRRLGEQTAAPDSAMESREELLWLLKATTNTAAGVTELTVLPAQMPRVEPVNINTADRPALLAIFGNNNAGLVERIIHLRNAAPLLTPDQVVEPATLQRLASYLAVRSSFFSVYARAEMGALTEEVYCLAKRDYAGNVQILRWIEH